LRKSLVPPIPPFHTLLIDLLCVTFELQLQNAVVVLGLEVWVRGGCLKERSMGTRQPCCSKINDGQEYWPDF
jgi:hypothetical protein